MIHFADQNAAWLATSAASVRRFCRLMMPVKATTTSEPRRLPICIGSHTMRQMKSGNPFTSTKSRSSQDGTVSWATTTIQLPASRTAPPSTATTSSARTPG